jgi:hypothetical protein
VHRTESSRHRPVLTRDRENNLPVLSFLPA